jgi:hypothetical protein
MRQIIVVDETSAAEGMARSPSEGHCAFPGSFGQPHETLALIQQKEKTNGTAAPSRQSRSQSFFKLLLSSAILRSA